MNLKDIPGYEGFYAASDSGMIFRTSTYGKNPRPRLRPVAARIKRGGYAIAHLCKEGKRRDASFHRCIWEAHVGPIPDGMEINHINGVKTDNRLLNLELCTKSENTLHKFRVLGHRSRGRPLPGSGNHAAKLTEVDIPIIRKMARDGLNYHQIASRYPVSPEMIGMIVRRQKWQHIP